jgi:hypothetical protein
LADDSHSLRGSSRGATTRRHGELGLRQPRHTS